MVLWLRSVGLKSAIEFLREQLLPGGSNVDRYHQSLLLEIDRLPTDDTDGFSGLQYSFNTELETLVAKKRESIETTMETDIESIDGFLQAFTGRLSRPGPSR